MKLNISLKKFKKFIKKENQLIFYSKKCKNYSTIENLYKFILSNKNSFIFESVEKGLSEVGIMIGFNPDKIYN